MARPPRGWLLGVLVTSLVFWYSGVLWEGYTAHEISPLMLAGGGILIVGLALRAQQALTNDDYKTSKATRISRVLIFLGVTVSVVAATLQRSFAFMR